MSRMRSRTVWVMSANASLAVVVTSPTTCTWPVVTSVSTATRDLGSWRSNESSTESLIASQILSGCPSVTDSLVNSRLLPLTFPPFWPNCWSKSFSSSKLIPPATQPFGAR